VGAGELVGRGPHVHAGVVENEVVKVDELALQPQCRFPLPISIVDRHVLAEV
jgi:hypothetical protein